MLELQLPFLDCSIYVDTDDMNIAESVCFIYKENAFINNRDPSDEDPIVRIKKDGVNMYTVEYRKYCINTASPYSYLFYIIRSICNNNIRKDCFLLHAFVLQYDDHCHLFLGDSYSGKSTLCYYLSETKYHYINDDVVLLNSQADVIPFLKALSLRYPSVDVLEKSGSSLVSFNEISDKLFCWPRSTIEDVEKKLFISKIFIIDRHGEIDRITRLSKDETFKALLLAQYLSGINNGIVYSVISNLISLPSYKLSFQNIDDAYRLISNNLL